MPAPKPDPPDQPLAVAVRESSLPSERHLKALELRVGGKTFGKIAEAMGVDRKTAEAMSKRALDGLVRAMDTDKRRQRALTLERLDTMLEGIWPFASKGDAKSVDRALRIEELRLRVLGVPIQGNIVPNPGEGADPQGSGVTAYIANVNISQPGGAGGVLGALGSEELAKLHETLSGMLQGGYDRAVAPQQAQLTEGEHEEQAIDVEAREVEES